jgi:hypothetical protein
MYRPVERFARALDAHFLTLEGPIEEDDAFDREYVVHSDMSTRMTRFTSIPPAS